MNETWLIVFSTLQHNIECDEFPCREQRRDPSFFRAEILPPPRNNICPQVSEYF
jgi:hypothetical protein